MKVLGFETSCDETAVALYCTATGLLAHHVYTQTDIHEKFGGVVPELASRDHVRKTLPLLRQLLLEVDLPIQSIDGIAYTAGPGLVNALMVGGAIARSIGFALSVPTLGVHHMEGHLMAAMLEQDQPSFPFLALLVSGGHTLLVAVHQFGKYEVLGESIDDAVGEAFDKTAKLLGLSYPGGPQLAKLAESGRPGKFNFPRPMLHHANLNFSFSGLKTSVLHAVEKVTLDPQTKADIAKGFEEAVVETLVGKCQRALEQTGLKQLVIGGGVGANRSLRAALQESVSKLGGRVFYPSLQFCTDNAAMIAYVGATRLQAGEHDDLSIRARPRWPLSELTPL